MKFCQPHWDQLKSAIERKGMMDLVSKSGHEVLTRTVEELKGNEAPLDPLMSTHWMLVNAALDMAGMYLLTNKEDGAEYCPLCEVNDHFPETEIDQAKRECKCPGGYVNIASCWIEGSSDAMRDECLLRGLIEA